MLTCAHITKVHAVHCNDYMMLHPLLCSSLFKWNVLSYQSWTLRVCQHISVLMPSLMMKTMSPNQRGGEGVEGSVGEVYYVRSSVPCKRKMATLIKQRQKKEEKKNWDDWNDITSTLSYLWEVTNMSQETYLRAVCSCEENMKHNICKHSLGLALRLGFCNPPSEAKDVPIGQKRKRGRPSKAKKALIRQ